VTSPGSREVIPTESPSDKIVGDRLGQVASPVAITMSPTATLREIAVQMTANDIGMVVIAGEGRLLGVVSERDLVRAIAEESDPDDERASDIMSVDVVSTEADASIDEAAELMVQGGVRHLPVVDEGRVIGVVSMRDLLPLVGD
jgi:MHS family proline/betaine transporter-like MFS transporter